MIVFHEVDTSLVYSLTLHSTNLKFCRSCRHLQPPFMCSDLKAALPGEAQFLNNAGACTWILLPVMLSSIATTRQFIVWIKTCTSCKCTGVWLLQVPLGFWVVQSCGDLQTGAAVSQMCLTISYLEAYAAPVKTHSDEKDEGVRLLHDKGLANNSEENFPWTFATL